MSQAGSGKVVRIRARTRTAAAAAAAPVKPIVARDAIALAFQAIGGVAAFAEWIKASEDNRKLFYTNLYPKIIAIQPGEEPEAPAIHEIRRTIVHP
jgi:hypothetical protein